MIDSRIPGPATDWVLWHQDTFDRESSPSQQASGRDIIVGLFALWDCTLRESVLDDGQKSFECDQNPWEA